MFAVQVTRVLRPVGVLLGGSGRARVLTLRAPHVAALMYRNRPQFRSRKHLLASVTR